MGCLFGKKMKEASGELVVSAPVSRVNEVLHKYNESLPKDMKLEVTIDEPDHYAFSLDTKRAGLKYHFENDFVLSRVEGEASTRIVMTVRSNLNPKVQVKSIIDNLKKEFEN